MLHTNIYRRGMTFTSLDYTWYEWARAEVLTLLALLVQSTNTDEWARAKKPEQIAKKGAAGARLAYRTRYSVSLLY